MNEPQTSKELVGFNVNDKVRVRLKQKGRDELLRQHRELYTSLGRPDEWYRAPTEDSDGWSSWQLWDLMNRLGHLCTLGFDPPFETEIQFERPTPEPRAELCSDEQAWQLFEEIYPNGGKFIGGTRHDMRDHIKRWANSLGASQPPFAEWQPIEAAPKGPKILVAYRNSLGNWRRVIARYYGEQELESIDSDSPELYAPAGWYECCETQEDIMRTDEEPELWQPLPAAPSSRPTKIAEQEWQECPMCHAQWLGENKGHRCES